MEVTHPGYCGAEWKTKISAGNTEFYDINGYEKICATGFFICLFILRISFYRAARKRDSTIDLNSITPGDYTLLIKGLRKDTKEEDIFNAFSKYFKSAGFHGEEYKVEKVNMVYDIGDFVTISREKGLLLGQLSKEQREENKNNDKIQEIMNQLQKKNTKLEQIKKKLAQGDLKDNLFAGSCFVTFTTQLACATVNNAWDSSFLTKKLGEILPCITNLTRNEHQKIKDTFVTVDPSPEPFDVLWENQAVTYLSKLKTRIVTGFIVAIIVGICFLTITALKFLQLAYLKSGDSSWVKTLISILITLLITIINMALAFTIRRISIMEKYSTITRFTVNVCERVTIIQFLNSTVILMLVNWLVHKDELRDQIWSDKGLANDAWFIIIGNIFLGPLNNYLNPFYLMRIMKQRAIRNAGNKCILTQKEANFWFEGHPVDMAYRYVNYQKTILISIFFSPMLPNSLLLGIIAVILSFWVDKYLLLRRHCRPISTGPELNFAKFHLFDIIIIIFALNQLLFDYVYRLSFSMYSIVFVLISLGHYFFGFHFLYSQIFDFKNDEHIKVKKTYSEIRHEFVTEYDRSNPVTQLEATQEYISFLKNSKPEMADGLKNVFGPSAFKELLNRNGDQKNNGMFGGIEMYALAYQNQLSRAMGGFGGRASQQNENEVDPDASDAAMMNLRLGFGRNNGSFRGLQGLGLFNQGGFGNQNPMANLLIANIINKQQNLFNQNQHQEYAPVPLYPVANEANYNPDYQHNMRGQYQSPMNLEMIQFNPAYDQNYNSIPHQQQGQNPLNNQNYNNNYPSSYPIPDNPMLRNMMDGRGGL